MNCLTLTLALTVTEYINLHKNTHIFHISGLMPTPIVRESDYTTLRRRTYSAKGLLQSSVAKTMLKKVWLLVFRLLFCIIIILVSVGLPGLLSTEWKRTV